MVLWRISSLPTQSPPSPPIIPPLSLRSSLLILFMPATSLPQCTHHLLINYSFHTFMSCPQPAWPLSLGRWFQFCTIFKKKKSLLELMVKEKFLEECCCIKVSWELGTKPPDSSRLCCPASSHQPCVATYIKITKNQVQLKIQCFCLVCMFHMLHSHMWLVATATVEK